MRCCNSNMSHVTMKDSSVVSGFVNWERTGGTADWTRAGALCQLAEVRQEEEEEERERERVEEESCDGGPGLAEVRQEEEEEKERKRVEEERKGERTRRRRVEVGWDLTAPATVECRSGGYAEELRRGERERKKSGNRVRGDSLVFAGGSAVVSDNLLFLLLLLLLLLLLYVKKMIMEI
ncbi:uncharacterized protein DS421_1g22970 [Arachis hypogaea]|nr:uncharacterized protein DS421_1g22970 [Arachis hypogaea]